MPEGDLTVGFYMEDYFTYTMHRAQHDSQHDERMTDAGIEYYEERIGKEQVEKDYQAAIGFWKDIEAVRLQNIEYMAQERDIQKLEADQPREQSNDDLEQ